MSKRSENMLIMIKELMAVNGYDWQIPGDKEGKESLLNALMVTTMPFDLSDTYYEAESAYLKEKMAEKTRINLETIKERLTDHIHIARGDITRMEADAIVNAANEKLLGCFVPGHKCIDNAIHSAAGLGLRKECASIMAKQGRDETVGGAKITKAYNLPSKYVVHTVGPNISGLKDFDRVAVGEALASCYLSILRAVEDYEDIKTLVFCSISTGLYGVPIEVGSQIALETIQSYLKEAKHHLEKVVIDVFSEGDYRAYQKSAETLNKNVS